MKEEVYQHGQEVAALMLRSDRRVRRRVIRPGSQVGKQRKEVVSEGTKIGHAREMCAGEVEKRGERAGVIGLEAAPSEDLKSLFAGISLQLSNNSGFAHPRFAGN
jgi:hypothetical protein